MDIEKKNNFILQTFLNNQNMISLADTKANISISIQSFLISIGLGTSLLTNTFTNIQKLDYFLIFLFYWIVISFIISSIIGIIISIRVYEARSPSEKTERYRTGLFYFGHITEFTNSQDYFLRVNNLNEVEILKDLTKQVYHLSFIVKKKMEYVNKSVYFLIFNLLLTISLIIISGYINSF